MRPQSLHWAKAFPKAWSALSLSPDAYPSIPIGPVKSISLTAAATCPQRTSPVPGSHRPGTSAAWSSPIGVGLLDGLDKMTIILLGMVEVQHQFEIGTVDTFDQGQRFIAMAEGDVQMVNP